MPDQPKQHDAVGVALSRVLQAGAVPPLVDAAFQAYQTEVERLRARCASLEAVAEAAKHAHEADSITPMLCAALAALDQHATEAAPHEVIHAISTPLTVMIATVQMGVRHGEIPKEIGESLLTEIKRVREIIGWPKSENENENKGR